jgi:Family of unknown function (DUF6481)
MSGFKDKGFTDRLSAAGEAKRAMAAKFKARPNPNDPALVERRAAQLAASLERDARKAERDESRRAEAARIKAESEAEAKAAAEQKAADEERAAAEKAASDAAREIQQKAARDARYAARKARK